MNNNNLYKSVFIESINNLIVYHGRQNKSIDFLYDFVGTGNDQFGPGFYFTTSPLEAWINYAKTKGVLLKVSITINNPITQTTPNDMVLNELLIKKSKFLEKNPETYSILVSDLSKIKYLLDCVIYIYKYLYKPFNDAINFLNILIDYGYDGIVVNKNRYIVFIPSNINVLEYGMYDIKNDKIISHG